MEKLYTVSRNKMAADYGSDHKLFVAKFMLKLKKVGETIRQFRYDLKQVPYKLYSGSDKKIQRSIYDRQIAWRTMDRGS